MRRSRRRMRDWRDYEHHTASPVFLSKRKYSTRALDTSIEPLLPGGAAVPLFPYIGSNRMEVRVSEITDKQRDSVEFRIGSRQEWGQRVAADYFLAGLA